MVDGEGTRVLRASRIRSANRMPQSVFVIRRFSVVLLAISFAVASAHRPRPGMDAGEAGNKETRPCNLLWDQVLRLVEEHSNGARQALECFVASSEGATDEPVLLARRCLEEWNLWSVETVILQQPWPLSDNLRHCYSHAREEYFGMAIFGVRVNARGVPLVAKLTSWPSSGTPNDRFQSCICSALMGTRYRPAVRSGRFVSGTLYVGIWQELALADGK